MNAKGRWLALLAALLGWMFDGMEMGLFPLIGKDALSNLLGDTTSVAAVNRWYGIITAMFLVGAATGGVLFGWLGDKIGRVRAMTFSVLLYSGCSGLCTLAGSPMQLGVLRFVGALGMGGEWALGVALVMELWPNTSRVALAGLIGAFGNLGYTICALISLWLNDNGARLTAWLLSIGIPQPWVTDLTAYNFWRLLLLSGSVPALLTLFIRFFVPESEKWAEENTSTQKSAWSGRDLLVVLLGAAIASCIVWAWASDIPLALQVGVTVVAAAVAAGCYLFPAARYLARTEPSAERRRFVLRRMLLAAGLSGVPLLATWAGVMWQYIWLSKITTDVNARPVVQLSSSIGAAIGCLIGAWLCVRFGRRIVYAALCVLSMITLVGFYNLNAEYGWPFILSAGLVGVVTAAFYGWLPLYLPELFPTPMRATGQGFGFNFGRIIAAIGALQTTQLLKVFDDRYERAIFVTALVYLLGLILIAVAPETRGKELPK
jgi:MFS transporter, SHS family, sialic acid transporter